MSKDLPNPIHVTIYSYKNKLLKEFVKNLLDKSSKKNNIAISVLDQSTLTRQDYFDTLSQVHYDHIFWDKIKGPCYYKNEILKESKYSYTLFLSDNVYLNQDWDEHLLSNLQGKYSIITGKNKTTLTNDGLFYLKKQYEITNNFDKSYFVSRDLIFGHTEILQQIGYPWYMKYYGEEEILSIMFFANNIKIYSCPDNFYKKEFPDTVEQLYTTFSKYHNYNEMIKLFKTRENKYESINRPLMGDIPFFFNSHEINLEELNYLPFALDDVQYDPDLSLYTDIDSKKFMTKINYID